MTALQPLICDRYAPDGPVDPHVLMDDPRFVGLCLKLAQGRNPAYASGAWCRNLFAVAQKHKRWAQDFFGRVYYYFDFGTPGRIQCDYALSLVEQYGLGGPGMLPMMIDVERGGENPATLTKDNVIDVTQTFAERYYERTGKRPTLYAGELPRALGITSKMGCDRLAVARYTPTLPMSCYQSMGWETVSEWQYCGTDPQSDEQSLAGYPRVAPGCSGLSDISVLVDKDGIDGLRALAA